MSNSGTILIHKETKAAIKTVSDKYRLGSYDNTLKLMCSFIIANELNPTENFYGDYAKGLVFIEEKMKAHFNILSEKILADSQSFRKLLKGIERDSIIPIKNKIGILDKFSNYELSNLIDEKAKYAKTENPLNSDIKLPTIETKIVENDDENIEGLSTNLGDFSEEKQGLLDELNKYKEALRLVVYNSDIEDVETMLGTQKRAVFKLSIEQWNYVNSLI